ncbi:hypothetical protein [Brevibacillus centrosporus]|uniref:hypothetical protein n=1 Tax=Brevibacillus centrosporus TaxID=54910 RepID=UPI002E20831B|nr:hypothetical protein [Brevibacillus centrosporus]
MIVEGQEKSVEQLLEEVSRERADYQRELKVIRGVLLDALHRNSPVDKVKWSTITATDLMKVKDLAIFVAERYGRDHKQLTADKIES